MTLTLTKLDHTIAIQALELAGTGDELLQQLDSVVEKLQKESEAVPVSEVTI